MFGFIVIIALLVLAFKLVGFLLKICGKLLGGCFSLLGYAIIGAIAVGLFKIALVAIPIILVIGIATIVGKAATI